MEEKRIDSILRGKIEGYCSRAERSEYDVRKRLRQLEAELSPQVEDEIIEHLLQNNFINPERYIRAFIHDKLYLNGWGRVKIAAMLRERRLPGGVVDRALAEIPEADYLEILCKTIEQKRRTIRGSDEYANRVKLMRAVASRGFESHLVIKYLDIEDK